MHTSQEASTAVCGLIPEVPMQDACLCPNHSQHLMQDAHPGSVRREAESPATPDKGNAKPKSTDAKEMIIKATGNYV